MLNQTFISDFLDFLSDRLHLASVLKVRMINIELTEIARTVRDALADEK